MPMLGTFANAGARGYGLAGVGLPTAPGIGTATATGSTSASVTYTAPLSDGGSTITSYTAVSSPGGQTATVFQSGSGTINISGLSQGTYYTFTVYATNALGNSPPSSSSNQIRTFGVPDAPTIGTATATGSTSASVTYTAPLSDGGSTITSYTAVASPGGQTATVFQSGSGTINISGLSQGTYYTFTVYATNALGNSSPSSSSNQIRTFGVPDAPTIGTAYLSGTSAANVYYSAPAYNGGSSITSYTAVSSPGGYTGSVGTSGSGSIYVSGLQASTSYNFQVYATNAYGDSSYSGYSNTITTPTPVPFYISVSPTSASTTIARVSTPVTSYSSFTVSQTSGTGTITVQEIQRPTGGSTTISPANFSLGIGGSQSVSISCTSPSGAFANNSYVYQFAILDSDTSPYPTFTFTQFR
jgi:hypothetical protein